VLSENNHIMAQSLNKVIVHIVFSTKHRQNFIDDTIKDELFNYLGGTCKHLECNPIRVGGYRNHVHILCFLSKKITLIKLLEDVKKNSSKWMKTKGEAYTNFYWQDGYGAFSVNPKQVDLVIAYIDNQEKHHSKHTYEDEMRAFFKQYGIEYDERYVWD
jgi:putative transposase